MLHGDLSSWESVNNPRHFVLISLDMKMSTQKYFYCKNPIVVSAAGAGGNDGYAMCLDIRAAAMVERAKSIAAKLQQPLP